LVTVVAFNFLIELLTALRLVRMVAVMQLVCSLVFAAAGIGLLHCTPWREQGVMVAFGVASLLATLVGLTVVVRLYRVLPEQEPQLGNVDLWQKLLPFAGWIWLTNLVANLFAVSDQFMLKHFSGLSPIASDSLVGQYYCSRVVPLLLVGVAAMIAGSLLPHLIKDWEAKRFALVRRYIRTSVKLCAVVFTTGGALVLVAAPLLFGWLLGGRYDRGLTVLPGTLVYCIWFSLFCVGYNYLQCVERARWGSVALATGLVMNLVLNYWMAPLWGLPGVVCATAISNLGAFAALAVFSQRSGMRWDSGVAVATLLPLSLCLGGWAALIIVIMVCLAGWVFDVAEVRLGQEALAEIRQRIANRRDSREPQSV
jgi:O-antigen/teichoic acid export membrane protein